MRRDDSVQGGGIHEIHAIHLVDLDVKGAAGNGGRRLVRGSEHDGSGQA